MTVFVNMTVAVDMIDIVNMIGADLRCTAGIRAYDRNIRSRADEIECSMQRIWSAMALLLAVSRNPVLGQLGFRRNDAILQALLLVGYIGCSWQNLLVAVEHTV